MRREDVLDHVMINVSKRIDEKQQYTAKTLKQLVMESIIETRQYCAGDTYIRHDKPEVRLAHTLWMQQKTTDKTMKEVYVFIANQIGDVSPRVIKDYVSQFIKGYNPHDYGEYNASTI